MSLRIRGFVAASLSCLALLATSPLAAQAPHRATLVERALFAEAQGRSAERSDLGAQAADLAREDDQELQWLGGRVRYEGQWRTPEEAAEWARSDARLQGFQKLRARQDGSVPGWIALGRFCSAQKLTDQANVYWSQVANLTNDPEAIRALWPTEQRAEWNRQRDAYLADLKERRTHWRTVVGEWNQSDSLQDVRQSAAESFKDLPGEQALLAAEAITAVGPKPKGQTKSARAELEPLRDASLELVSSLAKRRESRSTDALVHLAMTTRWPEVRDAAARALRGRPQNAFVPLMLAAMAAPIETKFSVYVSPDGAARTFHTLEREGPRQNEAVTRQTNIDGTGEGSVIARAAGANLIRGAQQNAARLDERVKRANAETDSRNAWIREALVLSTGEKYGNEPRSWWKWWTETNELVQEELPTRQRTYITNYQYSYYQNYRIPTLGHVSCFAAGTPVWTLTGLEPIEKIQVGDMVLAQNAQSGEWAFKAVLATTVGPAVPLLSVSVGKDVIVATKGHPFWVPCEGWQMAKQLKAGTLVHGWKGSLEVEAVADATPNSAHNLVVADFHSYCVGTSRILVHDNSMCQPTYWPLPGLSQSDFDRRAAKE